MLCSCTTPDEPVTPTPEVPEIETPAQNVTPDWLLGCFISEYGEGDNKKTICFDEGQGLLDLTFKTSQGYPVLPYQPIYYIIDQPVNDYGTLSNYEVHDENNIKYVQFNFVDISNPDNPMRVKITKVITDDNSLRVNVQLQNNQGLYNFGMFDPLN